MWFVSVDFLLLVYFRLCNDIHYVPDIAAESTDSETFGKVKDDVSRTVDNLDNVIDTCKTVLSELTTAKTSGLGIIAEFRKHLNTVLDDLEKRTSELLENKHKELASCVQKDVDKAGDLKKTAKDKLADFEQSNGNASKKFICQCLGKQVVGDAETLAKNVTKTTSKIRMYYKNDLSVSTYLSNLASFGTVREQKRPYGKLKSKLKYDVTSDGDKDQCNIWGTCTTGNGNILLADNANNKLKLLDKTSYKMVATCSLNASPRSLCRRNNTDIGVSLSNKSVSFITTDGGLEVKKTIQLEHNCFGLAMTYAEMYISDGSQKVYEYTLDGALLRTITQDPSGEALFTESRDITVSDDENKIHVADSRKGLVTLNKDGKILWRYSGSELKGAYGVCTDGEGNLLVTGILSNNVLQFGTNGERLGEIIKEADDLQSPVSVCYDKYNERVLVTKNGNFVYAFDFD